MEWWTPAIVPFLVALALFFVPGLPIALAARQKGFDAVALAPALSVAAIAVSAILAPLLGIKWSVWVPLIFALLIAAAVAGGFALAGRLRPTSPTGDPAEADLRPARWWSPSQAWAYAAFAVGAMILGRNLAVAMGDPHWVSQTYDAVFHLNALRYIADTANASSLHIGSMTSGGGPSAFYPAAWHGIASLVFELSGASIPVTANTMSLVVGAILWPLSTVYFIRQSFAVGRPALLATGAVVAAYVSFPVLLVYFGVLYPNSLGIALMPLLLGLAVQIFHLGDERRIALAPALVLGVLVSLALALAHPNVIMSALAFIVPMVAFIIGRQLLRGARREIRPALLVVQLAGSAALIWLIVFLWGLVRPPKDAGGWEPYQADTTGLGEALLNNTIGAGNLWVISILAIIGVYSVLSSRRNLLWLPLMWGLGVHLYVAGRSMEWDDGRDWLLGVWYHDPYRVAALLPVVAFPLAVLGVDYLATYLQRALAALPTKRTELTALALTTALVLGLVTWSTQQNVRLQNFIEYTSKVYSPDLLSPLLTPDEYAVLNAVADYVPEDATIITNPWTGASLAYAFSGRKVTGYHTWYTKDADTEILIDDLAQYDTNPAVCETIRKHNAYYAIYFGTREVNEHVSGTHTDEYGTLEYLAIPEVIDNGGVADVIFRSEGATLYRITACD
ncbi:DUF6541 family protein [Rothia nasimurium]|uniref:DUF6541 family protein n=1 Tax=Rothia nasimurium TaxID=85336 RepID=UPI001F26AEDD|nr:DUF6541 family protein [Rothia nasimurium]